MTHPQHTGSAGAEDSLVVALARAVDRTARRVERLDTVVAGLAADVTVLARALDAGTRPANSGAANAGGEGDGDGGMRAWLLADDPDQALVDLANLAGWIDEVYLRYRDAALPSCWLWHPEVVEELWWLRCAHSDAFHPERGSWLRVGDWHERQRPGVVRRITRAVGSCELALHLTDPAHPGRLSGASDYITPPAPAPLNSAVAQVAAAWAVAKTTPEPDLAQLAESDRLSGRRRWR